MTDIYVELDGSVRAIGELNDVDTLSNPPTTGQILEWNSTRMVWEPTTIAAGVTDITDLSDVDTSTVPPTVGQALVWDTTNWVPATIATLPVPMDEVDYVNIIGTPHHANTAEDIVSHQWSSGMVDGGGITNNGDGTFNVLSGECFIRATDNPHAPLILTTFPTASNIVTTNLATNYIYIDYNAGSPVVAVTLDSSIINITTKIPVAIVFRNDTTLNIIAVGDDSVDHVSKARRKSFYTETFLRSNGGAVIGSPSSLYASCTAGTFWFGLTEIDLPALDTTGADTFEYFWTANSGTTWTSSNVSLLSNTQYNDITTGLVALTNNKYVNHWVYAVLTTESASRYVIVYGQNQHSNLAQAQIESVPNVVPPIVVGGTAKLLGRYTTAEGQATVQESVSVFTETFTASQVTSHTELTDIGTNTHVAIDSHIADSTLHYTQAAISITESQISDLGTYEPADATILKDADIGVTVAAEAHTHEGTEILSTAVTDGYVLTADGAGNAAWEVLPAGLLNIVDDLTPQLGGDLDVNGHTITSTGATGIEIASGGSGDLTISNAGAGDIIIGGNIYPETTGTNGYVLSTNGAGALSWVAQTVDTNTTDLITDLTPQLGGDLDVNDKLIVNSASSTAKVNIADQTVFNVTPYVTNTELLVDVKQANISAFGAALTMLPFAITKDWSNVSGNDKGDPRFLIEMESNTSEAGTTNTNTTNHHVAFKKRRVTYDSTAPGFVADGVTLINFDDGFWDAVTQSWLRSQTTIVYPILAQTGMAAPYATANGATLLSSFKVNGVILPAVDCTFDKTNASIVTIEVASQTTWDTLFSTANSGLGARWRLEIIMRIDQYAAQSSITFTNAVVVTPPAGFTYRDANAVPAWLNDSTGTVTVTRPAAGSNTYKVIYENTDNSVIRFFEDYLE